jgi:hypothetical protein
VAAHHPFGLAVPADLRREGLELADVFLVRSYPVGGDFLLRLFE